MKKLCFGTYLNIIYQARAAQVKQKDLLRSFVDFADCDTSRFRAEDENFLSHLKSGHDQVPADFARAIRTMSVEDIFTYFLNVIIPFIDKDKYKNVILAFRDVIAEDAIGDDVNLGPTKGYTKADILHKTTFSFVGLITNLFIHCVTQVTNKEYQKNIKEITIGYVDSFSASTETVYINEELITIAAPLDISVKKKDFDAVFTEVNHPQTLTVPNPSTVKLYHLNVSDYVFDQDAIARFIRSNLGRYVFSRAKRNEYEVNEDSESLVFDAADAIKKAGINLTPAEFSEIMIYSFLECSLAAPKIMSKIELASIGGTYRSKSSGIHLLALNDNGTTIHQLVFCGTDMNSNLNGAINSAFDKLLEIKKSTSDEHQLVESNILNGKFDTGMTRALKDIIIPQKANISKPDTAFGIFLGYNVHVENAENMTKNEYLLALTKRLQADIIVTVPYIQNKIDALKLRGHSFYFYVLPLNDVDNDSVSVLKKALGV